MVMMLAVIIFADIGYQGIQSYHAWSLIPIKKSKKKELSESEKAFNRELSRRRIVIENINSYECSSIVFTSRSISAADSRFVPVNSFRSSPAASKI